MTTQAEYDARQAARLDRIRNAAERTRAASDAKISKARQMSDLIPFGQPILVGHHSEGRDRRYRGRIDSTYRAGFDLAAKAERLERKVAAAGRAGISADDPSAVAQLRAKLARLERKQADMKECNAIIRRLATVGLDAQVAALVSEGPDGMTAELAVKLITPDFCGRIGFPDYAISNGGAEIRRVRRRITDLEAAAGREPVAGGGNADGVTWGEDADMNRVWVAFPGKPEAEVRAELKGAGFRWAPSLNRWQRQTSPAAIHHAQRIAA
jgi:hypothetical protein